MRIGVVLVLMLIFFSPQISIQASQDESFLLAWRVVDTHGVMRIQNSHETRIVFENGALKLTKRLFADGSRLLAIRWHGQLVARHLLPQGWTPICTDGEWQDYLLEIFP